MDAGWVKDDGDSEGRGCGEGDARGGWVRYESAKRVLGEGYQKIASRYYQSTIEVLSRRAEKREVELIAIHQIEEGCGGEGGRFGAQAVLAQCDGIETGR